MKEKSGWLEKNEYDRVFQEVPRICVDLLITNADHQVLLTKRSIDPYMGKWHLPGGRIQMRESFHDAVSRIALSELATSVFIRELAGAYEFLHEGNQGWHSVVLAYHCVLKNPDRAIGLDLSQASAWQWFDSAPPEMIPEQKQTVRNFFNEMSKRWASTNEIHRGLA